MQLKKHDQMDDPLNNLELNQPVQVEKVDVDGAALLVLRVGLRRVHLSQQGATKLRDLLNAVLGA